MNVNGETVKLQMWDTAGQERFRCITQTYYRSANAVVVVYDIANKASFDCLPQWLQDVQSFGSQDAILCLVGNKSDLDAEGGREVPSECGQRYAEDNKMMFIETSAKDASNVNELIELVAKRLVEQELERVNSKGGSNQHDLSETTNGHLSLHADGNENIRSRGSIQDRVRQASDGIIKSLQHGTKRATDSKNNCCFS